VKRTRFVAALLAATITPAGAPATAAPALSAAAPTLGVRAAALIEATTGQRLYSGDADRELPIASTPKLMTALVALEHVHSLQFAGGAGRARPWRADERARPVAGAAAAECRRRRGGPGLQHRSWLDQPLHRDDEHARAGARPEQHALRHAERTRHSRQLLNRRGSGRAHPVSAAPSSVLRARRLDEPCGAAHRQPPSGRDQPQRPCRAPPMGQRRQDRAHDRSRVRAGWLWHARWDDADQRRAGHGLAGRTRREHARAARLRPPSAWSARSARGP